MTHKFSTIYLLLLLLGTPIIADNFLSQKGLTDLIVLTDHVPPYSYQNDEGEFLGAADILTNALFKRAGIDYSTQIVPWIRAQKHLDHHSNLLIYPLSRTKDREDKFKWIAPLYNLEHKIYGLSEKYRDKNIDISSGDYKFVCMRISANCELIKEMNVPEHSLITINNINIPQMMKMVSHGNVDFLLSTEVAFNFAIKSENIDPKKFTILNNYSLVITDYLASNLNLDNVIVEKLKAAAKPISSLTPIP